MVPCERMRVRVSLWVFCNVSVHVRAQNEFTSVNLAYAYATTSGVLRKAAILRHPVGRSDREMECAGGVEYQRGRAAVRQAFDGVVATMVRGRLSRTAFGLI